MNGLSMGKGTIFVLGEVLKTLIPIERRVKAYLDTATADSVLQDIQKVLKEELRGVPPRLLTIFDTYCVDNSLGHQYWNEDSLRRLIRSVHIEDVISEPAIQLLWRSFRYYAYHPFPRGTTDCRVDRNAFERAILLITLQSNDLLGTREFDFFWRHDDSFFHKASFQRLFRSIGLPVDSCEKSVQSDHEYISMVNDAMDVLILTQPHQRVHRAPSPNLLEPAARKILGNEPRKHQATRKDFSILLSLLMRMRLKKVKWSLSFHYGTFDKAEISDNELADVLVTALGRGQGEEDVLSSDQVLKTMDLLPNLHLRFYQLWGVIFQPPISAVDDSPSSANESLSSRIQGTISLFMPQTASRARYGERMRMKDTRSALEQSIQSPQRSDDITVTRLIKSLAEDPHPYLVLFTSGEETATTPVVGAYFPGPLCMEANRGGEKHHHWLSTSYVLFQLQPEFRLLQGTTRSRLLKEDINIDSNELSLGAIAASDKASPKVSMPYWIRDPEGKGASLRIEPEKQLVTLISNSTDIDSSERVWQKEGGLRDSVNKNSVVTIKLAQLHIFSVSARVDKDIGTVPTPPAPQDLSRYRQDPSTPRIEGEELRKRIEGFGSI